MHPEKRTSHNWLIKKVVNDLVRAHLPRLHGLVVDLGCGERPYEVDILAFADRYIGLDWGNSPHKIRPDLIADLSRPLPIASDVADCVVCFEVLEHVPEPATTIGEAYRVLRPGGVLLLSVPFQWGVHEAPWDYQRFTRYGLDYQLRKASFEQIAITPTTGFWSMWLLKLNYQLARLAHGGGARRVIRPLMIPIWWVTQSLAPVLDRAWRGEHETAGYFVSARKP